MPENIRIEDLVNPVFPDEVAKGLKDLASIATSLEFNVDAFLTAASESCGLDNYGSEEYLEPLGVVCESITKESNFNSLGRITTHSHIMAALIARLRVEDFYNQHPEIEENEIVAPIIIAGLPRSGTTHLQNLIAADTNLRHLPWWEAIEPIPSKEEWGTTEGRIERAKAGIKQRDILMPHFDRMHEMTWDHAHEEIALLLIAGSTIQYDTMGVLPSWREYYKSQDQTPYYMYMKRILKVLSSLRSDNNGDNDNRRWILKSPQHLEQFKPLNNAFPDATVLITHRDPLSVIASMATMLCYAARLAYDAPIDVEHIGKWWKEILKDLLLQCMEDRDIFPESRSMDIFFHEFMADDVATVKRAYELAGQEWDESVEDNIANYMNAHPRGRHGRVIYDLADFNINPNELRDELMPYIEHFNIQPD